MTKPAKVFVSYSSKDTPLAATIYAYLTSNGINAVKAPEDIEPGRDWAESIAEMIESASHMVLIWTSSSMASKEVAKELTLAMQSNTVIIPFQVQDLAPEGAWRYHLANLHWLQAHNIDQDTAFQTLLTQITGQTAAKSQKLETLTASHKPERQAKPAQHGVRATALSALLFSALALIINLIALLVGIWFALTHPSLNSDAIRLVGALYKAIPPMSLTLYVASIALALVSLKQSPTKRTVASTALLLTGLQLAAYVIGSLLKIVPG